MSKIFKNSYFLALNFSLILIIAILGTIQANNVTHHFEDLSGTQLEKPEHGMDLRYKPEGPLYVDMKSNISTWVDRGADNFKIPAYRVETNSMGARDDEFNIATNQSKIVFIGDSFTYGWGVNKSERYTEIAEKKLGKDKVESMNIAIPGTGIIDYYLLFKHKALDLDPDKVVIGFRYNDVRSEKHSEEYREVAREEIPTNAENREQKLNDFLKNKHRKFINEQNFTNSPLREYMIKMAKISEEEDVDLVFYLINEANSKPYIDNYERLSDKYNFKFINTPKKLRQIPDKNTFIRRGDPHYNARSHKILGENLAGKLRD